jgi:hypothetical protein
MEWIGFLHNSRSDAQRYGVENHEMEQFFNPPAYNQHVVKFIIGMRTVYFIIFNSVV